MMVHDVQNNQLQISSSRSIPPGSTLSHGQRSGAKVCISQVPGSRRSLEEALDLMRTPEIRASKQPDYFGGVFAAVCGGAFAAASDAARAADPRKTLAIGGVIARVRGTLIGSRALVQMKARASDDPLLVSVPVNHPLDSGLASSLSSWFESNPCRTRNSSNL